MYRKSKSQQYRDRQIYADYIAHLRNGQPIMLIYAILARLYDLSEERVRHIVLQQANKSG